MENVTQLSSFLSYHTNAETSASFCAHPAAEAPVEANYREFQRNLMLGQAVLARWTENCSPQKSAALVVRKNRRSVQVELLESAGHFLAGDRVTLPLRVADFGTAWTRERGVLPL